MGVAGLASGRPAFREGEAILAQLARPARPHAQDLLETARGERAASEEDDFFKRGREQALKFIQQQQFEQAAELLRNLLTLFPGDSILGRDLQLAHAGFERTERPAAPTQPAAEPATETSCEASIGQPRLE